MNRVDLHVHSNCSDGTLTPTEVVMLAAKQGLAAFALTDHDTTAGLAEAKIAGKKYGVEVIPGVELSTEYRGRDIHIVGLFIDENSPSFASHLQNFIDSRDLRNQKMCKKLADEAGMDITYEKLLAENPGSVITRAHYAKYMLEHGYVKSRIEAFDRYIGDRAPYYIPREKVTPMQGVKLIHDAGGVAVLAHPILYGLGKDALDTLVSELVKVGLDGIECIYSTYTPQDERQIRSLALKYNLLPSGGSDFHGGNKPEINLGTGHGKLFVPESYAIDLKARK